MGKTLQQQCERLCLDFLRVRPALRDKVDVTVVENMDFFSLAFNFSCATADEDENGDPIDQHSRRIISYLELEHVSEDDLPKFIEYICYKAISDLFFYVYKPKSLSSSSANEGLRTIE